LEYNNRNCKFRKGGVGEGMDTRTANEHPENDENLGSSQNEQNAALEDDVSEQLDTPSLPTSAPHRRAMDEEVEFQIRSALENAFFGEKAGDESPPETPSVIADEIEAPEPIITRMLAEETESENAEPEPDDTASDKTLAEDLIDEGTVPVAAETKATAEYEPFIEVEAEPVKSETLSTETDKEPLCETDTPVIEGSDIPQETEENNVPEIFCLNVMQTIVEEKVDKYIKMFGLCNCPRCRVDVIALTLSNLPPKYVVVSEHDRIPMLSVYEGRFNSIVISQVMNSCKRVLEHPRHILKNDEIPITKV